MMRARPLVLVLLLGVSLLARSALAQPSSPTPLDLREGQALFKEGLALHDQDREEEALVKFRASYARSGNLHALFNVARTEQITGRLVEAMEHFELIVDSPAADKTGPAGKDAARKRIDELAKQLARITIDAPPHATVKLDGKSLGVGEREAYVLPGSHVVEGMVDGRSDRQDTGALAAGVATSVKLFQTSEAAGSSPPPTQPAEPTTPTPPPAHAGDASQKDEPFWTTRKVFAVGLGVGAVAAFGVAVGLGVASQNEWSQATTLRISCPGGCSDLTNAVSSERSEASIATGFYIAGGVLAAGSVALVTSLLLSPDRPTDRALITPLVLQGGGGLAVHGSF